MTILRPVAIFTSEEQSIFNYFGCCSSKAKFQSQVVLFCHQHIIQAATRSDLKDVKLTL